MVLFGGMHIHITGARSDILSCVIDLANQDLVKVPAFDNASLENAVANGR